MKKILGLMIVISMFMLAGCSGRHVPSESSNKKEETKTETAAGSRTIKRFQNMRKSFAVNRGNCPV